jgi:sec-independent protein translocase protein TatA
MPTIGPADLIIVLVLALLVLGPKRLPEAGRSLRPGMREFKDSIAGGAGSADGADRTSADDADSADHRPRPDVFLGS